MFLAGCGSGGDSPVSAQNSSVIDLSGVTQNWDKNLPSASRVTVLAAFGGAAVRDNNTGLVWEKSPQSETATWNIDPSTGVSARSICINKNVGGQKGWRLPSIPELASLIDPSVAPGPTLPPGHPFLNVQGALLGVGLAYWSATTLADNPGGAWHVTFGNGHMEGSDKTGINRAWCVRGPMNADANAGERPLGIIHKCQAAVFLKFPIFFGGSFL